MHFYWFDIVGNLGVLLLIISYLGLQTKFFTSDGFIYSFLNLIVSVLLGINLFFRPVFSSILIEIFWGLISLYGVFRYFFNKNKLSIW